VEGSAAHVAGYLTTGEGEAAQHFGHVLFSLQKETGAAWRVATETLTFPGPLKYKPVTADDLIALMDAAGIQRALVLSVAYWYGSPRRQIENEYEKVRADNDWTAQQASRFPERLRAFCGFNPLKDYALAELERCAKHPHIRGLKFHFGNSRIDLRDARQVEQVRRVFRAANERRLPIVVHLRNFAVPYGRQYAEIFLRQILPAAPDIPVQIAHLAGTGPGYEDPPSDEALAVFAEAIAAGNPQTKNLYFDITTLVNLNISVEKSKLLAERIRQLGVRRVLYGSDLAVGGNLPPRQSWALFRGLLPLTEQEFTTIANNVAPYMR
jgi:predicted TIM-barrel fold metal-dependent hydrolase